jgi:hypothetical protein
LSLNSRTFFLNCYLVSNPFFLYFVGCLCHSIFKLVSFFWCFHCLVPHIISFLITFIPQF